MLLAFLWCGAPGLSNEFVKECVDDVSSERCLQLHMHGVSQHGDLLFPTLETGRGRKLGPVDIAALQAPYVPHAVVGHA